MNTPELSTRTAQSRRPEQADPEPLTYLEVLDDEYWSLRGEQADGTSKALRDAYVDALRQGLPERVLHESAFRTDLIQRLHDARRSALCVSGGGIRSATFGLGVLQGLARRSADDGTSRPELLGELDFISTVSGGGYLGAWFSAWATRLANAAHTVGAKGRVDGSAEVIRHLSASGSASFDPDVAPIRHLRAYSNYLTPKLGMVSGDTWALIGSIVRNLCLNWLVLIPLLAAVLLIPLGAYRMLYAHPEPAVLWVLIASAWALGGLATGYVGFDLPSAGNAGKRYTWYVWLCLVPLTLSAAHLNTFWAWLPSGSRDAAWWDLVGLGKQHITVWQFGVFGAVMHAGGMLLGIVLAIARFKRPPPTTGLYATAAAAVTGFAGAALGFALTTLVPTIAGGGIMHYRQYAIVAFPLVMAIFLIAGGLLVGLTSYITEDKDREWWARAGGLALAIAIAWLLFSSTVLFAGDVLAYLKEYAIAKLAAATGAAGWVTASLGSSANTPSERRENATPSSMGLLSAPWIMNVAARLALPVFVVLLAMLLAVLNDWHVKQSEAILASLMVAPRPVNIGGPDRLPLFWAAAPVLSVAVLYIAVSLGSSFFINVNSFSLHAMYRQRLIRAYLGASNPNRSPHPFTGFDERDNFPMYALTGRRPLHVVNIALNLVSGRNLAWQQRKAESFTSTRLHTGSCRLAYRPSREYGGHYKPTKKNPISLGTAMTISGAAASPNMGYNSSPLLTVVMTLFNARLGWWLGNPRAKGNLWKLPGPRFGVRPFIDEALGLTSDDNSWIYLSDGGHFENLGLYEMVLRRCHCIIVSDAGADPKYTYEDLGNAVRKIRVDFGISIEFDDSMPMSSVRKTGGELSTHHCAVGRIRYSTADPGAPDGTLIYLKPVVSGDEPVDVLQYGALNDAFPNQPTSDQFFDESQFESYRRLGLHTIDRICETRPAMDDPSVALASRINLGTFIDRARAYVAASAG